MTAPKYTTPMLFVLAISVFGPCEKIGELAKLINFGKEFQEQVQQQATEPSAEHEIELKLP